MAVDKLYESDNFLVVNKPYDMYINSDDENEKNTVTAVVAQPDSHLSTSECPLHFVQRLDYATSGVLCIAKNKTSASRAGRLFEKRLTRKYYIGILRGHIDVGLCDIEYNVGVDTATASSSHKMSAVTSEASLDGISSHRMAHSRLLVLETGTYCGEPVTAVLLKPVTGRRHQLRVHCSAIGHTILGDYTYSDRGDTAPHRMFLHARRLVLPLANEPLDIMTSEPFFSDSRFLKHWQSLKLFYRYRTNEEFLKTCELVDRSYVIGMKYHSYRLNLNK